MLKPSNRRAFLRNAVRWGVTAPFIGRLGARVAAATGFDPDFGTAVEAARAIRAGQISSRELTAHVFGRIRRYDTRVHAFLTLAEEAARGRAAEADEAQARGTVWGPLHGVPIVIKDSFETAGIRTTSGSKQLEDHVPEEDAAAVARLREAGAVILGKSNLPEFAGDWQSANELAETTRNPWDPSRTPGGSTGGGAAALAAGLGFLELGSDIGGSIRIPSHFCGVYGLKPSLEVVPLRGHIPPMPGAASSVRDLAVAGPMARSAEDLLTALKVLGGPEPAEAIAYSWQLPWPRRNRLQDYRIGYVLEDPFCPVSSEVREVLGQALEVLGRAGLQLEEGWPASFDPEAAYDTYLRLMYPYFPLTEEQFEHVRGTFGTPFERYARIYLELETYTHLQWWQQSDLRLQQRRLWQDYFSRHDAFLMPVAMVPAFPHITEGTFVDRTVSSPEGPRLYLDFLRWVAFPSLTGCPAAAAPVGRTSGGLPVGLQIMGPFLEDATPIDVVQRITDIVGGFQAPPGFR